MSSVEDIKSRLDIVDYVQQHVPDLKKAGRNYKACCPFHNEKTPSFVVNPETQTWRCYGACSEGGDIFSFAEKVNGWTFTEALQSLGELAGVEVRKQSPQQKQEAKHLEKLRGILKTAADWYHQHLLSDKAEARQAYQYLTQKRGFTHETIVRFQIGYAPQGWTKMLEGLTNLGYPQEDVLAVGLASQNESGRTYDRFRERIMIPIYDGLGNLCGFGARALKPDDNPKYLNSPQTPLFDKSGTLFGLHEAKRGIRDTGEVVIVEGYMDVIQAHQAGYTNVIAQMGTALTEPQLKQIVPKYTQKIILALDADAAGQNATRRSLEVAQRALSSDSSGQLNADIRILRIEDAKDPDDVLRETPQKWADYVQQALPVADFLIQVEMATLPDNPTHQERRAAAMRVLPLLTAAEDSLARQDNLRKLSMRLHIPLEDLWLWVEQNKRKQAARRQRTAQQTQASQQQQQYQEASSDSSEEPPFMAGLDDDNADNGAAAAAHNTHDLTLDQRASSRAAEGYCLKNLLASPDLLYDINRLLRELAGNDRALRGGPLASFGVEDFSHADYRALMATWLEALGQDRLEPLEYMRQTLDLALQTELDDLLLDERHELQRSVRHRFSAQMQEIMKEYNRMSRPGINYDADVCQRVLTVRQQRLLRERQEITFLLRESQEQQDADGERRYYTQLGPSIQAERLLHREIKRPARPALVRFG